MAFLDAVTLWIVQRKPWWNETNNHPFFKVLLQKLRQGGVDVALGCKLSLACILLEESTAVSS